MERVIEILNKTQFGCMATVWNKNPYVRPFQFQFEKEGRLFFCTDSDKDVFRQIKEQPVIEYAAFDKALNYVRIRGVITMCTDINQRTLLYRRNPYYKQKYSGKAVGFPVLFYMEHGEAKLGHFDRYPPEIIKF